MSGKKERLYVMLWQEEDGFCTAERSAFGSALIEIKNDLKTISVDVKNMKNTKEGYDLYLISSKPKKSEGVYVGRIDTDKNGKAHKEFIIDDRSDSFNVVAVIWSRDIRSGSFSAPIVGYRDGKVNWKKEFSAFLRNQAVAFDEKQPDIMAASAPVLEKQSEKTDEMLFKGEEKKNPKENAERPKEEFATSSDFFNDYYALGTNTHDNFKRMVDKFNKELDELENLGVIDKEKAEKIRNSGEKTVYTESQKERPLKEEFKKEELKKEELKKEDPPKKELKKEGFKAEGFQKQEPKKQKKPVDSIDYIFENNPKIMPFPYDDNLNFIRIDIEELILFDVPLELIRSKFLNLSYAKYKHIIIAEDEDGYVLGVPDKYNKSLNREASSLGFKKFKTLEEDCDENNAFGYWLKTINK
ncbi:MAG: hypothetical protein VB120_06760 [Lachnospiraceae bacterium]|nr:hypothetical protein [Lachnospiraceae bacterium]